MMKPYQYCGIEAQSYDLVDELSDFDDYPFYRFAIESNPGKVLELGCGTGRILARLAEEGVTVTGVDSSSEMIDICRAKIARLGKDARVEMGDMREFDFGDRFDTILIPGFTIQLLLDPVETRRCLECCLKHLQPNGQLVVTTYMPWEMLDHDTDEKAIERKRASETDSNGMKFIAYQGWQLDRAKERLTLLNRFQQIDKDGTVVAEENRSMTLRWYLPYDMQRLLGEAGFSDISVYGDFVFEPPEPDAESVIYVARE